MKSHNRKIEEVRIRNGNVSRLCKIFCNHPKRLSGAEENDTKNVTIILNIKYHDK